ncbi:hypothetical protein KAU34_10100, partial [candidate division WOR-3 bacterium]|nr:hypothetical protein [candidate division WOR-3 bacterium]
LSDSVKESKIFVEVDYSALPNDDREDNFTVIKIDGVTLKAVGWWENIRLEDLVGKVFTECEVTEQDIQVEEIEGMITQRKNFIMLPKYPSFPDATALKITAIKLVNLDVPNKQVTFLAGIRKDYDKNYMYRYTIDYDKQIVLTAERKYDFGEHQVLRFYKFASAWWVLLGYAVQCSTWFPNDPHRYVATYLKKLDSNYDVVYTLDFDTITGVMPDRNNNIETLATPFDFYNAKTGSILSGLANDIFFIHWIKTAIDSYHSTLKKLHWTGSALTDSTIKTLERGDGQWTKTICDNWATGILRSTGNYFYYGIRRWDFSSGLDIMCYSLTHDNFTLVLQDTPYGGILNFTRNIQGASYHWQGYFSYQKTVNEVWGFWIGHTGGIYGEGDANLIKNMIYCNPDFPKYYIYWLFDSGYYRIVRRDSLIGQEWKETDASLDSEYSIDNIASMMFNEVDGADGNSWMIGLVSHQGNKSIIPFLFMPGKVPYIQIADFTDMNCKDALTKLSEGFCCNFDIYGMIKGRFYFRGKTGGEMTLDSNQCIKQPVISYWENQCDGVIVENSEKGIRYRKGNTGFGDKIIEIDNVFVSSQGMAEEIAGWLYAFFNERRLLISVDVKFLIEIELFDKITIKLRNKDGTLFREIVTIVIETSFE